MLEVVHLRPIDHDPEGLILTTDGQRKGLSPAEGHSSPTLLGTPLAMLLAVSNHRVLIKPRVVMHGEARGMAKVHMKP